MAWHDRIRNAVRRDRVQSDARRELLFHIQERTDELRDSGLSPDEADREARRRLGNLTAHVEAGSDMHVSQWLEAVLRNLRLSMRSLAKAPAFSATVIVTLALGIGANSAVFSAIDAVLLRPLSYKDSERLVSIGQYRAGDAASFGVVAPIRVEDWSRLSSAFDSITGYYTQNISELSGEFPERLVQASISPRFAETWGVEPVLGRGFTEAHYRVGGAEPSVLISERFWRRRFNADPGVLGKTLRIGTDASAKIIGVLPASFRFLEVDLWSTVPTDFGMIQRRDLTWYTVVGRLKSGVTFEQARSDLDAVQAGLAREFPDTDGNLRVMMAPFKDRVVGDAGRSLWLLYGSVTLLLLIACTNIAALLLARAQQRRQEISVRYSLGAGRTSLVAQLLSEALVLAVAGAAAGLLVAASAADVFGTLAADLPRVDEIHLDWRIVAYTMTCAVPVTLLCGLLPAIRITGREGRSGISEAGRTQVSSRNPIQWTLVGAQVALAVTLLAGAGLLVRSLQEVNRVSPGFEPSRVLAFNLTSSFAETNDWPRLIQRTAEIIGELKAIPGVESAASSALMPGVRSGTPFEFFLQEGRADSKSEMIADLRVVSASYFQTMRIPLLAGEYCSREIVVGEVLINRSFADRYLGDVEAVGLHLTMPPNPGFPDLPRVIRGIVADAREFGLTRAPAPLVYMCGAAMQPGVAFLVRTRADPDAMAGVIRSRLADLEPSRSVFGVVRLASHIDNTLQEDRLRTVLLTSFAVTAVLLATLGVYGTLAYFVNLRRREVGLRIALGAERARIVRQFLKQGLRVSAVGAAAGLVLALSLGNLIAGMLYGVTPTDIPTLTAVIVLVLLITTAASLIPAFRASRVDPMRVLREE